MTKEVVTIKEKKTSLSVANTAITAVLRSNTQKTGIRLYDNDCLGIAGAIGAYNDNELTNRAKHMLNFKLPYNAVPTENAVRSVDLSGKLTVSDEEFVAMARKLMEVLREKYPKFSFSHKVELIEIEESLVNDKGTNLVHKDRYIDVQLMYKHKDSKSLMDGGGGIDARAMDFDTILHEISKTCGPYEEKIDFSEAGEMIPVVVMSYWTFGMKFITDLSADMFAMGASLFSGKTGQKLFSDDFSLAVNRNPERIYTRFFDGEGVVLPDDKFYLIENGVLKSPYTNKRTAKQYNLPISGSAHLEHDSAPGASPWGIAVLPGQKTIKELLGGKKAILVVMASGGDFTPQGEYASPIQVAYMFDGEKILGRLPQLSMTSHVNDMFGKDFIGMSSDGPYVGAANTYLAVNMNVKKTNSWM